MEAHSFFLPSTLLVGRVSHAGGREGRALHLICERSIGTGRFERAAGDPLCGHADRFPHLATYRQRVVCVADVCPRCLVLAVTHRFLSADVVHQAQEAYARLRVLPGAPPASSPWDRLPTWSSLSDDPISLRNRGVSGLAVTARHVCAHPQPWSASMGEAWFKDQVTNVDAGQLHRCPLVLRIPAPERLMDRVPVLVDAQGQSRLRGSPVARIGSDLVVAISRFEVALQLHRPAHYPADGDSYRKDLERWHRYPLTDRARADRWQWRRDHAARLQSLGCQTATIAAWFFETPAYLTSLIAQAPTVQNGNQS